MRYVRVTTLLAAASLLLPAPAAAQTSAQSDADLKEIAGYRLTMANVKKFTNVMRAMAEEMKRDPKYKEALQIKAELEKLEQKDELTGAESEQVEKLRARLEALEESDSGSGTDTNTLAGIEAQIRQEPRLVAVIEREGFTPREYATFTMAYLQAAMIVGFSQGKVDFAKLPAGVNPDNVRFILEHKAELDALQKEFEALSKK